VANFLRKFGILLLLLIGTLEGKDLGVYGHVFPVVETNLLKYLKDKIENLSEEDLQSVQKKIQEKYILSITKPNSLNLSEAKTYSVYYYDPTIIVQNEIKDKYGKIIVPLGKRQNPLETGSLKEDLLIFDGSNLKHLSWAKSKKGKWILTGGKPLEIEKVENKPVYFDQKGILTKKLGINAVPARVSQEGFRLKIEEIPCDEF